MDIRQIKLEEKNEALELILDVFMKYVAPDYPEHGVGTFKDLISNKEVNNELEIYGAFVRSKMVGVIATRNSGEHIVWFFVKESMHKQGIGKSLFQKVLNNTSATEVTVNSSPYAIEIYKRLGFETTTIEQFKDGIRYTPMVYKR